MAVQEESYGSIYINAPVKSQLNHIMPINDAVRLADGYFYGCYKKCDEEADKQCTVACGVNICDESDRDCYDVLNRYVEPMYELKGPNMHVFLNSLMDPTEYRIYKNGNAYVTKKYVEQKTSSDDKAKAFVKQFSYLDNTRAPRLDEMLSYTPPIDACVNMSPCTGPASAKGVCCGAPSPPTVYTNEQIARPNIPNVPEQQYSRDTPATPQQRPQTMTTSQTLASAPGSAPASAPMLAPASTSAAVTPSSRATSANTSMTTQQRSAQSMQPPSMEPLVMSVLQKVSEFANDPNARKNAMQFVSNIISANTGQKVSSEELVSIASKVISQNASDRQEAVASIVTKLNSNGVVKDETITGIHENVTSSVSLTPIDPRSETQHFYNNPYFVGAQCIVAILLIIMFHVYGKK